MSRRERIGRVSSEWFARPDEERYLSLPELYDPMRDRAERATTRAVESRATRNGETSTFTGNVKALSINTNVAIRPADKASEKAPDYRLFAGSVNLGANWGKTSR